MIKATRKGTTTQFNEKVWKTGQPQRYGWVEIGAPPTDMKELPLELIEFAEIRSKRIPPIPAIPAEKVEDMKEPVKEVKRTRKPTKKAKK